MDNSLGIYIGRFQPFHNGHKSVVKNMIQDNKKNIIILGTLDTDKTRNIYTASWRKDAIQQVFPDIDIKELADNSDDEQWICFLIKLLEIYPEKIYTFYCGDKKNDYAIQIIERYKDLFGDTKIQIKEISRTILPLSATQIRDTIKVQGVEKIETLVPKNIYKKIKAG